MAIVPLPRRCVQAAEFNARRVPQNCETGPENGPDSRPTWWSRKRDHGLRPELSTKGSFVSKSYTEWEFVVAARRRRGPFSGPESGPQNGTGNWSTGARKRLPWFQFSGAADLRFCASAVPFVARALPTHARPTTRLAPAAAQPAAPQSNGGRRWPGERGGRACTRHAAANSAVSLRCPPVLVPPSGPVLRTV